MGHDEPKNDAWHAARNKALKKIAPLDFEAG